MYTPRKVLVIGMSESHNNSTICAILSRNPRGASLAGYSDVVSAGAPAPRRAAVLREALARRREPREDDEPRGGGGE